MVKQGVRRAIRLAIGAVAAAAIATPGSAFLFWTPPVLKGAPVKGDEPGLAPPTPGATSKEFAANLLWSMRAGLNVAALQCQFSPALMTVANYNSLLRQHTDELKTSYDTLSGYFKRTKPKGWQTALDQYTTRVYNGFSTLHAQLEFCDTAAQIGRDAIYTPRGKLTALAQSRMREFRNSLVPTGDRAFAFGRITYAGPVSAPLGCLDSRGRVKNC